MTTNEDTTTMGDLLRFPHRDPREQRPQVDGTSLPEPRTGEPQSDEVEPEGEPGAELARDTERAPVPSALRRRAGQARDHLREHGWDYTKTSSKFLARHSYYLAGGAFDTAASVYGRWTGRDIDVQIAEAKAAGEHGIAADLLKQRTENKKLLLERLQVWGKFLVKLPIGVGGLAGLGLVITLVASVIAFVQPGGYGFTDVWSGLFTALASGFEWTVWALTVPAPLLLLASAAGMLVHGYNRRRQGGDAPAWARPGDTGDGRAIVPTEEAVLDALRHLGVPKLNEAFKNGWGTTNSPSKIFESPTVRDGRGYRTQLILPKGVDVEMVVERKNILAHNLTRFPSEVWPTVPKGKPGVMDLWVADQNVLNEPAGKPPWLAELETASSDYFTGVPVGKDIRGDIVHGLLFEANYALAGMMGSGKSSLILDLVGGAALDPLVDIDCFVLAENADYEPLRPRLSTLRTGPGEDVIEAAVAKLQALWDDLEPRGQALKDHGNARKSSRELATKDERLRPRIVVLDECQNLFTNKKYGEWAADIAYQLVSTARKYGVTLILATPEPSTDSLPRKMMSIISNKACFAIGDQRSNDAILGTGSYKKGITATELEPKTVESPGDVGTAMCRGFKAKPGLLRTFYIDEDEMARVAARGVEQVNETGGVRAVEASRTEPEDRDLLEDLAAVLGTDRANAADVPALLRDLDPTAQRYYAELTGKELVQRLHTEHGLKCPNVSRKHKIIPDAVRGKLAERRAAADDDEDAESDAE